MSMSINKCIFRLPAAMLTLIQVAAACFDVGGVLASSRPLVATAGHRPAACEELGLFPAEDSHNIVGPTLKWILRIPQKGMEPVKVDRPQIKQAARYLIKNPGTELIVIGYACNNDSAENNFLLGESRAKLVKKLLVARGVEPDRISIRSDGDVLPYFVSETGRRIHLPHRVEMVIRYRQKCQKNAINLMDLANTKLPYMIFSY